MSIPTTNVLLGAGASVEAGVPAVQEMARRFYDGLNKESSIGRAIDVAIGGLRYRSAVHQGRPFAEIDIEQLYEVVVLLSERESHPLSTFVGSWSQGLLSVGDRLLEEGVKEIEAGRTPWFGRRGSSDVVELRRELVRVLGSVSSRGQAAFSDAALTLELWLDHTCTITEPERVRYLDPIFGIGKGNVNIMTLNYDNSIELAASHRGVGLDLGLGEDGRVRWADGVRVKLCKLHGSVGWADEAIRVRPQRGAGSAAVVFGAGSKLRSEGPFMDLLFSFREFIQDGDQLYVCGYSFRDGHVNHIIVDWLMRAEDNRVHVIDPSLERSVLFDNMNASLIRYKVQEEGLKERIDITRATASDWLSSFSVAGP